MIYNLILSVQIILQIRQDDRWNQPLDLNNQFLPAGFPTVQVQGVIRQFFVFFFSYFKDKMRLSATRSSSVLAISPPCPTFIIQTIHDKYPMSLNTLAFVKIWSKL